MADVRRFLPGLNDDQFETLTSYEVLEAHNRVTTLAELVAGWTAHVDRIEAESTRSLGDRDVWAEHDFVAMLHLRDRLAAGLQQAPTRIAALVEPLVLASDQRFEAITAPDSTQLLERVVPEPERGTDWWWQRVPLGGPIVEALQRVPDRRQ